MKAYLSDPFKKRIYNKWLFKHVSKHYNSITGPLSFFRDTAWKMELISSIPDSIGVEEGIALDIATGNGTLAVSFKNRFPRFKVIGADLSIDMLKLAFSQSLQKRIIFTLQDLCYFACKSCTIDCITGGYALRNAPDLRTSIKEIHRVLKKDGVACFLDFSRSHRKLLSIFNYCMLKIWGSFWGLILLGKPQVYGYIADSLIAYPDRQELHRMFSEEGFSVLQSRLRFFGFIELLVLQKTAE